MDSMGTYSSGNELNGNKVFAVSYPYTVIEVGPREIDGNRLLFKVSRDQVEILCELTEAQRRHLAALLLAGLSND